MYVYEHAYVSALLRASFGGAQTMAAQTVVIVIVIVIVILILLVYSIV